jgi:transcriptional regulator with XRE-family HTH domain
VGIRRRVLYYCTIDAVITTLQKCDGFRQEKLAEKSDLSTVFISRIQRGVESPSVDDLVKIAKALGVLVRDLVEDF